MNDVELRTLSEQSPYHRLIGLDIQHAAAGVDVRVSLDERFAIAEPAQIAHGGIVATLLDTAATFALIAESGHDWTTVDLRVDYLRPTPLGALSVHGEVVRRGRSIGNARSSLTDPSGKLCATATGTFVPASAPDLTSAQ
jgi:uncharacterized protein (TIGR00369 family)